MARANRSTLIKLLNNAKAWAVCIGLIVVFLRLPTLFEPHRYADEEIYLTLGLGLKRGLVLYRDIHDNKPPLLYFIAAIAGNVFWFRFILLVWHGINLVAFWKLTQAVMAKAKIWLIGTTTLLFAIATAIPLTEGNIANGENFMIMPATWGAYLLWKYRQQQSVKVLTLAGFLFALAFLFKIPVAFDLAGIGLFLFLINAQTVREKLRFITSPALWGLFGGFLIPIGLSISYYASKGAFAPYVKAALFQNIGYLSSWGKISGPSQPVWQNDLIQRGIILIGVTIGLYLLRRQLSKRTLFVVFWFIFSLFGALLSSRPYPHYLLEPMVPFALLVGLLVSERLADKLVLILIAALLPLAVWHYQFWYYKSLPYYQNFWRFVLGQTSTHEYFGFFNGVNRNYQIAGYVLNHTLPEERIFVWGTEPTIYALSKRLPVGRYTVSYHIADFEAWEETMAALEVEPPSLIVAFPNESKKFPQLEALLAEQYTPAETVAEAIIYERLY